MDGPSGIRLRHAGRFQFLSTESRGAGNESRREPMGRSNPAHREAITAIFLLRKIQCPPIDARMRLISVILLILTTGLGWGNQWTEEQKGTIQTLLREKVGKPEIAIV